MSNFTDRQIKSQATMAEKKRVFENMNSPQTIYAECSDGMWIKEVWKNPNGRFGWDKWRKD